MPENIPDAPGPDAAALAQAAGRVSDRTQALTEQIALLRQDLAAAEAKAEADTLAAEQRGAAEVAAERRDRRRATWKFAIVIALDVVLSGVSLGLYVDQRATDASLHRTQQHVLCPLYALLVESVHTPQPGETAAARSARLAAAQPIEDGYRTLGCLPALPSVSPPH